MKKSFQTFLGLFGLATIVIALLHVVLGPSAIPGSIPVNATMDSEDRFYATLFAAYGVALLSCIRGIERKSRLVYFLAATFFVGGLARVVSMLAVGLPNTFFIAMTVLELVIPAVMVFMQSRISNAAGASQSAAPAEVAAPASGDGRAGESGRPPQNGELPRTKEPPSTK